jgi:peptidoglycan/xylan/chitin deacetylase (PgdA/CDA1 family)
MPFVSAVLGFATWLRPASLSVLLYHRVRAERDPLFPGEVTARDFGQQLDWVCRYFTVLSFGDAINLLKKGKLPARSLVITFDDGYADNASVAWPILQSRGVPATLFVATGFLDAGRMWNDSVIEAIRRVPAGVLDLGPIGLGKYALGDDVSRHNAIRHTLNAFKYLPPSQRCERVDELVRIVGARLPDDLMLSREALRRLAADGMEIGAHTVNHPILALLDDRGAREEIADGRDELESLLRQPITLFAYPNGKPNRDYSLATVNLVRSVGFGAAVSTAWGAARPGDDLFQIPRFTPWDRSERMFAIRMAENLMRRVERAGDGTASYPRATSSE